jgi:hypothetical protein
VIVTRLLWIARALGLERTPTGGGADSWQQALAEIGFTYSGSSEPCGQRKSYYMDKSAFIQKFPPIAASTGERGGISPKTPPSPPLGERGAGAIDLGAT